MRHLNRREKNAIVLSLSAVVNRKRNEFSRPGTLLIISTNIFSVNSINYAEMAFHM